MGNAVYWNNSGTERIRNLRHLGNQPTGYQQWTNYASSPVSSLEYAHQFILIYNNYWKYLYVSDTPISCYIDGGGVIHINKEGPGNYTMYVYSGGTWVFYTTASGASGPSYSLLETNENLYTDAGMGTISFAKTTTLEQDNSEPFPIRNRAIYRKSTIDIAADLWSPTENPHANWSYGLKTTKQGELVLYDSLYNMTEINPAVVRWTRQPWNRGNIWKNTSASILYGVLPDQLCIHPGSAGEWSVIRWVAPRSGTIGLTGYFGADDTNTMTYSILQNNAILLFNKSLVATTESFDLTVSVTSGDYLDFQIGDNYTSGSTPIDIIITGMGGSIQEGIGRINL